MVFVVAIATILNFTKPQIYEVFPFYFFAADNFLVHKWAFFIQYLCFSVKLKVKNKFVLLPWQRKAISHNATSAMLMSRDLWCDKSKHYKHLFIYLSRYLIQIHLEQLYSLW